MQRGAVCVWLLHGQAAALVHAHKHPLCRGAVALSRHLSACYVPTYVARVQTLCSRSYAGQALGRTLQNVQRDSARLQRINVALQHRVRFSPARVCCVCCACCIYPCPHMVALLAAVSCRRRRRRTRRRILHHQPPTKGALGGAPTKAAEESRAGEGRDQERAAGRLGPRKWARRRGCLMIRRHAKSRL